MKRNKDFYMLSIDRRAHFFMLASLASLVLSRSIILNRGDLIVALKEKPTSEIIDEEFRKHLLGEAI